MEENYTHQNSEQQTQSQTSTNYSRWIAEQLTLLEIAKDQKLTKQRKQMYVADLEDLPREQLADAFVRARRELVYFPQIAELRKFAGAGPAAEKQVESVEANDAFQWALVYVSRYGVERMATYVRGKGLVPPPAIPARIEYALRRIGGLAALRDIPEDAFPFRLRDFAAGFNEYPLAEEAQRPALPVAESRQLEGEVLPPEQTGPPVSFGEIAKQLADTAKRMPEPPPEMVMRRITPRPVPPAVQLTPEQIAARRPAEQAEIERYRKAAEDAS